MKQTITVKQLQELTEEQKERLREWWVVREGDRFFAKGKWEDIAGESAPGCVESYDFDGESWDKKDCLPLLSVGQCIELLEAKDPGSWSICCSKSGGWYITSSNLYAPKYYIADGGKDFEEIIDALWQAVKEVL